MISAFTLSKSREPGYFIPFFCHGYEARKPFEVSFQERSRKVLQVTGKILERSQWIIRKTRVFVSPFVSK